MTGTVTVDIAGAQMGGAARYAAELHSYLARSGRTDVRVIGAARRVDPAWLVRREMVKPYAARRVAANNVGFVAPGGERWTLLRNALHFLTDAEACHLESRRCAPRCGVRQRWCGSARGERMCSSSPPRPWPSASRGLCQESNSRVVVRPHPVSADSIPRLPRDPAILCPVLFAPYKRMDERLTELLAAVKEHGDPSVRVRVTARRGGSAFVSCIRSRDRLRGADRST